MSAVECPPTPPTLPEGDAALTPPPKSLEKSDSDESLAKSVPQRRPSSPDHDAKCAICLGNLDNLSHTDKCYHKFCFICLKEWSKVKAECPLCKTKFKSIIHTIKSDGKSEQFDLPPPPPRPPLDPNLIDVEEHRRFRYPTTMPVSLDAGFYERELHDRLRLREFRGIAGELARFRDQLPNLLPPGGPDGRDFHLPTTNPTQGRASAGNGWSRRRGRATSEFRRDLYLRNLYVDPESISDITGRYRDSSPAWYRTNPAQTHRLVPWLNRELNVLLEGSEHQSAHVTQKVLQFIERFEIRSPEFHEKLLPYLANRTDHFQHEFYHYARSVYDMIGYDRTATYVDHPPPSDNHDVDLDTPVGAAAAAAETSDSDDIMVVDEVRGTNSSRQSPIDVDAFPMIPLPPPPIDVGGGIGQASSSNSMSTLFDLPLPLFDGPSTSNGITNGSAPLHRLVIPASDSSDDSSSDQKRRKNNETSNFVEIVDVVKPRHERTPEIIDLSSEVEAGSDDQTTKNKRAANNTKIEAIEISSDSEDLQVDNAESTAPAHNSDNVQKQAAVQLEDEIAARAEFKRILESERFTKRRILSYLQDFQPKKKPKPSFRDFKNKKAKDEDAADKTWEIEDNEAAVASGSSSTSHLPSSEIPSRKSSKGKGKGKSSSKNNSKKSTPNDESTSSSSRKKKKKHKKSDKPPPSPALNTSSSDADDENDYEKQPRKKSSRKQQKSKSKRKDKEKKQKKVNSELAKILKKRKDRKRSSTAASSLNSSTASEEEKPLSKWKVSINSSRKTSQSTLSDGSAEGGGSHTFVLKPEAETEDLRLFLSRKRPRILDEDSSGSDDERLKRAKTVKSVVVVPK